MVVAGKRDDAAIRMGAEQIGVFERVSRAVHARTLAVPDAEDAVILGIAEESGLLRAPDRCGRKVFVEAGLEDDVMVLQVLAGCPKLLVVAAERRTAIAGNEAGGVESGCQVAAALNQWEPDQSLGSSQQRPALVQGVFVI